MLATATGSKKTKMDKFAVQLLISRKCSTITHRIGKILRRNMGRGVWPPSTMKVSRMIMIKSMPMDALRKVH